MVARLLAVLLGVWLIVSPAVLGYSGAAAVNARAVGPVIVGSSLIAVWQLMRPLRWVELAVGPWLVAAPWVLYKWYGVVEGVNTIGVGLALMVLAFLGGKTTKSFGGGWRVLLRVIPEEEERS